MTTTVTVDTHDWPVEVQAIAHGEAPVQRTVTQIAPHERVTFRVTQSTHLRIFELPLPPALPEAVAITDAGAEGGDA